MSYEAQFISEIIYDKEKSNKEKNKKINIRRINICTRIVGGH